MQVFAFQAVLIPYAPHVDWPAGPVLRTVAVREDQTLEQLHEALRLSFGTPYELDPDDDRVRSGRTALSELGLRKGKALAYLFDFRRRMASVAEGCGALGGGGRDLSDAGRGRGGFAIPVPPLEEGDVCDG
jgi:hypothetical protein